MKEKEMKNRILSKVLVCTAILGTVSTFTMSSANAFAEKDKEKAEPKTVEVKAKATKTSMPGDSKSKDGVQPGDVTKFHMDYTVPNNIDMDKLTLEDSFAEVLAPVKSSVHVYLIGDDNQNGEEITSKGTVNVDGSGKLTWTVTDNPKQFAGKKIRIVGDASLKYGQDYEKYKDGGTIKIPNVGSMVIHDKANNKDVKFETDKVTLTPNIIKGEQDKAIVVKGKDENNLDGVKPGDTVPYKLTFKVTNDEDYHKLIIEDDVPDQLDVDKASIDIKESEKSVKDKFNVELDDNTEKITLTSKNDGREFRGKTLVVTFNAKLKYDTKITDKQVLENEANLKLDDKDHKTDKVTVKTEIVNASAEKFIATSEGLKKSDELKKDK